jgi:hypothetical protein
MIAAISLELLPEISNSSTYISAPDDEPYSEQRRGTDFMQHFVDSVSAL